jgi:hypothetical protein
VAASHLGRARLHLGNRQQFTIGVALSGGGFRATLHSLGVLLYLVDAGINKSVTSIVSVSGGSITSAYVGQYGDFADMRPAEFREIASKLARFVVNDGLIPSLWTRVYLCLLIGIALFLGASFFLKYNLVWTEWGWWWPAWLALIILWALLLLLRGVLFTSLLKTKLFNTPTKGPTRLRDLSKNVDHTFCATDLSLGVPFLFTSVGGGMVYSDALGWGVFSDGDGEIGLDTVVRASAAFPGAIPPKRLSRKRVDFWEDPIFRLRSSEKPKSTFFLSDGGVSNNLGTDWWDSRYGESTLDWRAFVGAVAGRRTRSYAQRNPQIRLIVNSSSPLLLSATNPWLVIPIFAEIVGPRRVISVLYNSTVVSRIASLSSRIGRLALQLQSQQRYHTGAVSRWGSKLM